MALWMVVSQDCFVDRHDCHPIFSTFRLYSNLWLVNFIFQQASKYKCIICDIKRLLYYTNLVIPLIQFYYQGRWRILVPGIVLLLPLNLIYDR